MPTPRLPRLASNDNLHAIQMFASFFVPFYFFHKGMSVPAGALTWQALGLGILRTACALPLRRGSVWLQRRLIGGDAAMGSLRVATALAPRLIFTLVLATILRERFQIPDLRYGALLVYAGISTILPSHVLTKAVDFDAMPDHWQSSDKSAGLEAERAAQESVPRRSNEPA